MWRKSLRVDAVVMGKFFNYFLINKYFVKCNLKKKIANTSINSFVKLIFFKRYADHFF